MNKRERRARNKDNFSEDKHKFKTAIQILVGLALINTTLIVLLPSYLGFSSSSSLSYYVNDGWCTKGQGIGSHCFGDFYYPFNFSNLDAPWAAGPNQFHTLPLAYTFLKFSESFLTIRPSATCRSTFTSWYRS